MKKMIKKGQSYLLKQFKFLKAKIKKLNNKQKIIFACIILTIIPLCYLSFSLAKYVVSEIRETYLLSKEFYFYSNVLNGNNYEVSDWDGENNYTFKVDVRNYIDELRWTDTDITYTVSIECTPSVSSSITCSANNGTIISNNLTGTSNIINIVVANEGDPLDDNDYIDIDVTVSSTSPFAKTLNASYKLNVLTKKLNYVINDSFNQEYFDLIISNHSLDVKNVNLDWDYQVVSIDLTNESYLSRTARDEYVVNNITYINGISLALAGKTVKSIRFYKTDKTQNYTYPIINPNSIIIVS